MVLYVKQKQDECLEQRKQDSIDGKMSYLIFISVTLLAVLAKQNSLQSAQKKEIWERLEREQMMEEWRERADCTHGKPN